MRIRQLRLKNKYKRFFDLTIDLGPDPKRIIALVGPNGCGKSSIFDGLLFVQNSHNRIGSRDRREGDFHSMEDIPSFDYRNIEINFVDESYEEIRKKREGTAGANTIFSFRSCYRYNQNVKIAQAEAVPEIRLNNYGASVSSDIDDKMERNYRRLLVKFNTYRDSNDYPPSVAKKAIIDTLNKHISKCLNLEIFSLGDLEAGRGTLFFKKEDQPTEFEFNVLSSGEKEVVDILLDLYLRQDEFNNSVFLIDEPELHINTSVQRKLLVEINALVGENCQIWVATHSVGFLRALQDELKNDCQIIEFKEGTNWASESITLKPIEPTRQNWQSIFRTALDDLTSLVAPKLIIYCEGKLNLSLDERTFNNIFSKKYHDAQFISSTNKSESQKYAGIALAILNKAFTGVIIRVLQDRDDETPVVPSGAAVEIRKLKRREFENYLFDWEILQKAFPSVSPEDYRSLTSDIVNDDVKSKTNQLIALCGNASRKDLYEALEREVTEDTNIYRELEEIVFEDTAVTAVL